MLIGAAINRIKVYRQRNHLPSLTDLQLIDILLRLTGRGILVLEDDNICVMRP